jgi:hypothetical protein
LSHTRTQIGIGVAAIAAALLLTVFAIPAFVSSPSNVRNVILSPLFWPYCLAGLTALAGLGLIATARHSVAPEDAGTPDDDQPGALARLAGMAVIMGLYMVALPRLGMVWTSMIAFVAVAFLIKTHHPKTALACGILVPLVLYAFFAHVAGVAIPQGLIVRLP